MEMSEWPGLVTREGKMANCEELGLEAVVSASRRGHLGARAHHISLWRE